MTELYHNLFDSVQDKPANNVASATVEDSLNQPVDERLNDAFTHFEHTLNVPKMLEIRDLQKNNIDASQVQTYVSTIRNEFNQWNEKYQKWMDQMAAAQTDVKATEELESQKHEADADRLYDWGMTAFCKQKAELDPIINQIVKQISEEVSAAEDPVDYEVFTERAMDLFAHCEGSGVHSTGAGVQDEMTGFDFAIDKFENAKNEYDQVFLSQPIIDKKTKCDAMIREVNDYRENTKIDIEKAYLDLLYLDDRADRAFKEVCDHFDHTVEEAGSLYHTIIEETENRITASTSPEGREQIKKEMNEKVAEFFLLLTQ